MNRRRLELIVTLPWLAAAVVLLAMTRLEEETQSAKLGLFSSSAICFSIGCLTRTSLALHDLAPSPPPSPSEHGPRSENQP